MSTPSISLANTTANATANMTEREANRRIDAANQRVQATDVEVERSIQEIRDRFQKQYENENARQQAILETQRMKGYEQIRDLQRTQQGELRKTRSTGEADLATIREYYRNAINSSEGKASQQIQELESELNRRLEAERATGQEQEWELRDKNQERLSHLQEDYQNELERLTASNSKGQETMKTRFADEKQKVQEGLETKLQDQLTQSTHLLENLENRASQEIRQIRQETANKLSAYASRQEDPFYKMMDVHAELKETDDAYILTATIPEHERDHLSVSVQGDNLMISGYRRNEENLDLGNGHSQGSASYQSFHETFPLSWPVDASRLTREYADDQVIIRVPKKNEHAFKAPKTELPKKARLEHPVFPKNLPLSPSPSKPSSAEPGSGTLLG